MKNMDNHRRSDMKRWKHVFKKGMAFVLSLAMVAGLVPAMSGGANTVQAATGSGTEPSVTAYATKDQLMTAFTPDSNGDATTIGKLVFGKNSSSVAQEWHILGKDEGVSGDNTIIFVASPIATKQAFEDDDSNKKTFASSFGVYETNPSDVYPNHYGASDLRVALKNMATNTSYFTTAEQGLMNPTTVRTNDILNSTTYTTTDKLYALTADGTGSPYTTIKAGSDNNTVLAESSYWRSGEYFWLRSPSDYSSDNIAMLAYPGKHVYGSIVRTKFAVQPASNLNLSSVLFASAATAASSDAAEARTIADGTAMTLRLDGTGKDIGTATYNTTTGDIKAVKGTTSQTVALVVQGNDGTNNWYYSKKITGTDVVNVSDIVAESNTPASIDLSACKIWLEATDSTENLTYAVNATETTIKIIHSVAITDIETPVSNTALDTEASCATTGVSSTTPQITWTSSDSTAGYNTSYTASITLTAATGYEFTDSTTATVLGNNATSITKNTDGTLTVTYDFPATAKDKLISITAPQAITVANGTAYDAMNLPATVNIVTEGNTESSAPVTWNTTAPASGSYEPSVLTQQTVTLNGTVTCPDSIDDNGVPLTTTITITISAAGIVGAPTVNLAAGTYTENQSVTLTSSTEGATIYYTTDGSEPTITGGVPAGTTAVYTAPIAVTGTEGESITTTIKAIAVKDRMQNSSVEKFTYTIQIPVPKYEVNVTNGSGSGNYAQGSTVTITANTAPNGQRFKDWSIESGNITLASSTSDTTTFVMPAEAVRVKANYEAIPTPVSYKILDGANSDWKQNTEETITIRGNGDFSKFVGVKIDGNTIDAKNYTAKEGSTIITLTTDYLKTLSIGTHTFEIVWTDGSASTNFTVSKNDSGSETPKDDDKNKNDDSGSQTGDNHHITAPQTGDNSHLTLWISLLGASLIGLLATLYMRKKKDNE
jgi:bacterial group 3 Ig-like protein